MSASKVTELVNDALAAIQWCLEQDKHYHPARFLLATAYEALGRCAEAESALSSLFTRRNMVFAINVWEMNAKVKDNSYCGDGGSRGGKSKSKGRRGGVTGGGGPGVANASTLAAGVGCSVVENTPPE